MTPRFKAVALDMMGVVYTAGDDLRGVLIPFLKDEGITVADEVVIDAYRQCYRGSAPGELIWQSAGIEGPYEEIESRFFDRYALSDGAMTFLETMNDAGIAVFSLSNDVAGWAERRRNHFGLDAFFAGAVISGEHGVVKPDAAIYEILARLLPCAPEECLFADDREGNLDGAGPIGLKTVLFGAHGSAKHQTAPDFEALRNMVLGE